MRHHSQAKSFLIVTLAFALSASGARVKDVHNEGHGRIGTNLPSDIKYTVEAEADRVINLPGWGPLESFNMFGGYITVNEEAGRALFYVLVESERSPIDDPLVLWLNGGPGCSSLGGGLMSELGPFFPNEDGKTLQANPFAWNQLASILFIESPAFVGFSYSNTTSDRFVGDARTAADSRAFLLGFMKRFPHFKDNDLYISGESYAGHYVPNLALEIVKGNKAATDRAHELNLRGFLVGNPWTDTVIDNMGAVDYWWAHALIGDETAAGMRENCDFSIIGPLSAESGHVSSSKDELCQVFCDQASDDLGNINIYEIYADVCLRKRARSEAQALSDALGTDSPAGLAARVAAARGMGSATGKVTKLQEIPYDPCIDNEVEMYLNLPEVQRAIHANQTVVLPGRWSDCSKRVQYSRRDLLASMLPVYEELLASADLRILVYSGDVDGIVPVVGTRRWTAGLGLETKQPWRPWLSNTQQVGGYIVEYEGLSFATVRNAGHMVPYVQPERMYYLFNSFLRGQAP